MAKVINVHEAKTHLSSLLERVRAGEEIILAKNGQPYARLVPLEKPKKRRLGFMRGRVDEAFFEPLPEAELRAWE
ncbi:prevent-host-death family protein [Meiothermus luteus]|jgi:prevent-host-death family protein|uniref:Antitoxin n=1 Tax=Meiothermus luteus TaxID=2026184 RepID=A0A399EJ93_9DEIN|nr:type II toxin-antitoxin system prevent-host-death family antitoxin [Meiothermus luteus]RIH84018.1 prevent-host-death family protein [Meiothermus luteus]RMH53451.1 MAG: type II toxin-antitoxin system prevent-host-death family antitoxin [Deinococcota bacterium]